MEQTTIYRANHKKSYLLMKRAVDIIIAAVALVVLFIPMALIALLIKCESPGPAIFVHKRIGKDGKPLPLLKFRTMYDNAEEMIKYFTPEQKAEWQENYKLDDDPCITRIGKFLRRTSLDELPQLVNILKGELSVVGPRPVVMVELEKYGEHKEKFLSVTPGLSGFLTGQSELRDVIQPYSFTDNERKINVITAGQYPPNPVELLNSVRMARFLEGLRNHYDYILLDLPPVGEVSDALAVARETDGILLVVRQNVCSRPALSDTIAQFEFVGAKILGVVTNCVKEAGLGYRKKYYYRAAKAGEIMKTHHDKKESDSND